MLGRTVLAPAPSACSPFGSFEESLTHRFPAGQRSRLPRPDLTTDSVLRSLPTGRTQEHLLPQDQTPPRGTPCPGQDLCELGGAPGAAGEQTHTRSGRPRAGTHERLTGTSSAPVLGVGGRSSSALLL